MRFFVVLEFDEKLTKEFVERVTKERLGGKGVKVTVTDEIPTERRITEVDELVSVIEDFVNTFNYDRLRELGRALASDKVHRTLQQNIMRVVLAFIEAQATKKEERYDARNEATVHLCRKLLEGVEERYRHLPTI